MMHEELPPNFLNILLVHTYVVYLAHTCVTSAGDTHWTCAGSGMMHEELPETPGVPALGLQIFVNLAPEHKEVIEGAFAVTNHILVHSLWSRSDLLASNRGVRGEAGAPQDCLRLDLRSVKTWRQSTKR